MPVSLRVAYDTIKEWLAFVERVSLNVTDETNALNKPFNSTAVHCIFSSKFCYLLLRPWKKPNDKAVVWTRNLQEVSACALSSGPIENTLIGRLVLNRRCSHRNFSTIRRRVPKRIMA